ncbi:unnamed protein product [Urochloa humidicola]
MDPQAVQERDTGIRSLSKRIQLFPVAIAIILLGILVPLINESSNQKQAHNLTMLCAYFNLLFWVILSVLTYKLSPRPRTHSRGGYVAIKLFLHLCVIALVTLSFSLSQMMRMNKVVAILILVAAAVFVAHRAWQCVGTELDADVAKYKGNEEVIHHVIELSTMTTTMVLGAWFSSAFFYFQNYPEDDRDAWLLPSQYLTFFISVAASIMLLKSIARSEQPLWRILVLMYGLYTGLVVLVLAIGASRAGRYRWWAPLALVPEAVAVAVWFVLWVRHKFLNWWRGQQPGHQQQQQGQQQQQQAAPRDGGHGEQQPHEAIAIGAFAVVIALVSYNVKRYARALSTLYDEVFVICITGAGVAALGWRMLTQPPIRPQAPGVRAAARTLAWSAICLAGVSLVMLFGIIVRLVEGETADDLVKNNCTVV